MPYPIEHAFALLAQRLMLLRGLGIVVVALLLFVAQQLELALAYPNLVLLILAWLVIHAWVSSLPKQTVITEQLLLLQLVSDLLVVSCLLAFSGGIHNPFFALLLLPLLLGIGIISLRGQIFLLGLVLLSAMLLMWLPQTHHIGMPNIPPDLYQMLFALDGSRISDTPFNPKDSLAKLGIWVNISLMAILVSWMLAQLHQRLQEQSQALERAYRQQQEQAHLLQLGLTAAATAHELATPLATISLLASEAQDAYQFDEVDAAEEALAQIQDLVEICKQHIHQGLNQEIAIDCQQAIVLDRYLQQQISRWQNIRPQASANLHIQSNDKSIPCIQPSYRLSQILVTLLNNAADASSQSCEICVSWDDSMLLIQIHDHGGGFDENVLATFPALQLSQKADGHGVGLSLAYYQVQQLGGQLSLRNLDDGAEVSLSLPYLIVEPQ